MKRRIVATNDAILQKRPEYLTHSVRETRHSEGPQRPNKAFRADAFEVL